MSSYLVPWSGGLDSTMLIDKLVDEGHSVEALYYNLNSDKQDARQLRAVTKMHEKYFSKKNVILNIQECNAVGIGGNSPLFFTQFPYHIFNIMRAINHHDYVAIAFVMNDDAISYLSEMKSIYDSYDAISGRKLPELVLVNNIQ